MLSSDFHRKENDGFRDVSVHPGLATNDYGVYEVGITVCGVQHVQCDFNIKLLLVSSRSVIFLTTKIRREYQTLPH